MRVNGRETEEARFKIHSVIGLAIATLKRRFPSLIRRAEHSCRLRFKKKPSLKPSGGRPRSVVRTTKDRKNIRQSTVFIPKSMMRRDEKLSELSIMHELRATLCLQNHYSQTRADQKARKLERGDMKRLFPGRKSVGWLLRGYYQRR